ncbi:SET domain-containing protein [Pluteus cervinus]|uniref:SET domain-containing protein n=1 Tax=Pluteus cervinus TaxID=181527 RepID=A0ACD3B4L4_9AGAR|nr:SET domain-containing protein [Pluteus cervinus]
MTAPFDNELPAIDKDDRMEIDDHVALGTEVFRSVWNEFYTWEADDFRLLMQHLSKVTTVHLEWFETQQPRRERSVHPKDGEAFDVYTYVEGNAIPASPIYCEEFLVPDFGSQNPKPHPQYEFCTPISRNMPMITNSNVLQFVPYADDPKFQIPKLLRYYAGLTWQHDPPEDPDREIISLEVARRLHFAKGLSYDEIDDLGQIYLVEDLLDHITKRDIPRWPGAFDPHLPLLTPRPIEMGNSLFEQVNTMLLPQFCPNLNCLASFCPTHRLVGFHDPLEPAKPEETAENLKGRKRVCGDHCYLKERDYEMDITLIDQEVQAVIKGILDLSPDTVPCTLAYITRQKCYEVFAYRCKLFSRQDIEDNQARAITLKAIHSVPTLAQDEFYNIAFLPSAQKGSNIAPPPPGPCNHDGACNYTSGCPCYRQRLPCERACRCEQQCAIRWKGCKCKSVEGELVCLSSVPAGEVGCACIDANRECDPELCGKCKAKRMFGAERKGKQKGKKGSGHCGNVRVQLGMFANLRVKRGRHGLGAFTRSEVDKGQYVGEYTGELRMTHRSDNRYHRYTKRNYVFGLDVKGELILDSARMGNETRYLNHGEAPPEDAGSPQSSDDDDQANCEAMIIHVNGERRLVLKTLRKVKANRELLLNYGDNYWIGGDTSSSSNLEEDLEGMQLEEAEDDD